jgi:uncharacterized phage-associated protein
MDALITANYFLALQDADAGDLISNLKLQKLLYYAQGLYLASTGQPLFEDSIQAWMHGPVVPTVYHSFKSFGAKPLPVPKGFDPMVISAKQRGFLDEVYRIYGQFSAWKLRSMTHDEPPYRDAASKKRPIKIISHASMKDYFRQFVNA